MGKNILARNMFAMTIDRTREERTLVSAQKWDGDGNVTVNFVMDKNQIVDRIAILSMYSEVDTPSAEEELRILRCARDLLAEEEHNSAFSFHSNDAYATKDIGHKMFVDSGKYLRSDTNRK